MQRVLLYGVKDPGTGAVLRAGWIDSAVLEGGIAVLQEQVELHKQRADRWHRQATYLADEFAAYPSKRNRPSSPETIQQDAEIAKLRDADRYYWTLKRLGNRYGMTECGIRKACKRYAARLQALGREQGGSQLSA